MALELHPWCRKVSSVPVSPPDQTIKGRKKLSHTPESESAETAVRRRPTRRHRRNRLLRRGLLLVACASLGGGFASVALQHLSPSLFRASKSGVQDRNSIDAGRNLLLLTQQESLRQIENRPVYPYSVVAGGVKNARDLKWMAQHDPVVASHYAGFDYDRARIVRLLLTRTAYVSYRIGNKVYFTRHRVTLEKGETVITDGKITARTRCGNRVEDAPRQTTSTLEPPAAAFDEPAFPTGIALSNPPLPFESSLLNRPGPSLPLGLSDPFVNGTWVPITPPPLPGVCGIGKKPTGTTNTGTNGKGFPCNTGGGGGGGEVPEPGTWLLFSSGLAAMYWKTRQRLAQT
jgi:PEP-CTERM motif